MTDALQFGRTIEIKRADVSDVGMFAGYGSTFDRAPDRAGDIIARGAFAKSLQEHRAAGSSPGMLWAHDIREPVGKWLSLAEDDRGLKVSGRLTLALARAKDAHALLKDDALSLSIGYRVRADGIEGRNRVLKDLELLEISLVSVPANPHAVVTSVKDLRGPMDLQRALQDIGFSQRDAKRIVAGGWAALSRQDPELKQAAALLRARAAILTKGI